MPELLNPAAPPSRRRECPGAAPPGQTGLVPPRGAAVLTLKPNGGGGDEFCGFPKGGTRLWELLSASGAWQGDYVFTSLALISLRFRQDAAFIDFFPSTLTGGITNKRRNSSYRSASEAEALARINYPGERDHEQSPPYRRQLLPSAYCRPPHHVQHHVHIYVGAPPPAGIRRSVIQFIVHLITQFIQQ